MKSIKGSDESELRVPFVWDFDNKETWASGAGGLEARIILGCPSKKFGEWVVCDFALRRLDVLTWCRCDGYGFSQFCRD